MSEELDLDAIRAANPFRGRERLYSAEHRREYKSRVSVAQGWARSALVWLHKDDFDDLYRQALAKVYAERGPLPD